METTALLTLLRQGELDQRIDDIYGAAEDRSAVRARLEELVVEFGEVFPGVPAALFTAPGRTEMGGNHTDHQQGQILAGSVTLDMIACAGIEGTGEIRVSSAGYPDVAT